MKNTPRVPLTELVSEKMMALLKERGLTPGDSIPPTGELAELFNVSRTVVREALAELTGRGLLDRKQGREGIVAVPGSDHLTRLFESRMASKDISFERLQEFREILEIGAAQMAARHSTRVEVAQISDRLHIMRTAADDESMLAADVEFHRFIAYAANPLFGLVLDGLSPILTESRRAVWSAYVANGGKVEVALDRHVEIRDRIASRDETGAAAAMLADLSDTREGLSDLKR